MSIATSSRVKPIHSSLYEAAQTFKLPGQLESYFAGDDKTQLPRWTYKTAEERDAIISNLEARGLRPQVNINRIYLSHQKSWDNTLNKLNEKESNLPKVNVEEQRVKSKKHKGKVWVSKGDAIQNAAEMGTMTIPIPPQKVDTLTELKAISKLDPRVPNLLYNQALKDFAEKKLTVDEFRNVQARVTEANAQFNPTKYAFRGRNEAPLLAEESGFTIKPKMVYSGSYTI